MDAALTWAPAITDPCGSVTMPEILAVCDCALELRATDKTIKKVAKQKENNARTEKRMCSLLSRLAREVKVVRVSGIVSGFRGCGLRRSPGSAELRRAGFPPPQVLGGLYV